MPNQYSSATIVIQEKLDPSRKQRQSRIFDTLHKQDRRDHNKIYIEEFMDMRKLNMSQEGLRFAIMETPAVSKLFLVTKIRQKKFIKRQQYARNAIIIGGI